MIKNLRNLTPRPIAFVRLIALATLLAGCTQGSLGPTTATPASTGIPKTVGNQTKEKPTPSDAQAKAAALTQRTAFSSSVNFVGAGKSQLKAALILPLSAKGSIGVLAESMRNAAEIAMFDFRINNVNLIFLDNRGTTSGTKEAAQTAIDLGVDIVLGPLLSVNVPTAWQKIGAYDIPIVAFSSDTSVSGKGVVLLSVTPEQSIDSVVKFAVKHGLLRYAALIPETTYGLVSEQAFVDSSLRYGATVVQIERYKPNSRDGIAATERMAKWIQSKVAPVDAVFLPDTPDMAKTLAPVFPYHAVDTQSVRLLGPGLWRTTNLGNEAAMIGAWYSTPPSFAFESFRRRYRSRFKTNPTRLSALAYDAMSLVKKFADAEIKPTIDALSQPSGYVGIDGLFRFTPDGRTERELDILQVSPSGAELISPAVFTFASDEDQALAKIKAADKIIRNSESRKQ